MPISTVAITDSLGTGRTRLNLAIAQLNALGTSSAITLTGGTITGVTINNSVIGAVTPAAGTFTNVTVNGTLEVAAATVNFANNQISGDKVYGGTIDNVMVELSGAPTINAHATTKQYVDAADAVVADSIIAFAIVFGG